MSVDRVLAVIPARGGSKGIPGKNIRLLAGKPLLAWAVECLMMSGAVDEVCVSSDSDEILEVARRYAGVYALRRPDEISGDTAATEDALIDALDRMELDLNVRYGSVMCAQATSPFRTPETVRSFMTRWRELRSSGEADAMLSLHESAADHWIRELDGGLRRIFPDEPRRRQGRRPVYVENSCLYVTDADALRATRSVLGTRVEGFLIGGDEALDINEPLDLEYAEWVIGRMT